MSDLRFITAAKEGKLDKVKQASENGQNLEAKDSVSLRACGSDWRLILTNPVR